MRLTVPCGLAMVLNTTPTHTPAASCPGHLPLFLCPLLRSGMETGVGYRESPGMVQQTVATPGIAVASATTPPVARQGEEVGCVGARGL